jgi:hypothetical protein
MEVKNQNISLRVQLEDFLFRKFNFLNLFFALNLENKK